MGPKRPRLSVIILPHVHLRKPCYDFDFLEMTKFEELPGKTVKFTTHLQPSLSFIPRECPRIITHLQVPPIDLPKGRQEINDAFSLLPFATSKGPPDTVSPPSYSLGGLEGIAIDLKPPRPLSFEDGPRMMVALVTWKFGFGYSRV